MYFISTDLDMNKLTPILKLLNQSKLHLKYTRTSIFYLHQNYSSSLKSNNELVEKHLDLLKQYNFHKPSMETMLGSNEIWNTISPTQLKKTIEVLQSYKFSVNDISDILKAAPDLCSIETNEIIATLEAWLTCQFITDKLIDMLCVQPVLLKIDKELIPERIPTYLLIFNNNRNKLILFLKLCPEVMYENFDDIIEKYNYIRHTMGLKPKELLNSRVLCSDLNFIKTRHTFLDRSGQFQYKTKDIPEEQLQNPTLNSIFDTTDRMFAEKIAKMSVKEYETFSSYYAQELAEEDGESDLES